MNQLLCDHAPPPPPNAVLHCFIAYQEPVPAASLCGLRCVLTPTGEISNVA
jgi:hypothetical protein